MRFMPYTGKQHTLYTYLSVDECLRRLREEVREPPLPTWKLGGYMPLALPQDQWILRNVEDHHFRLLVWPVSSRYNWYFFGTIETQNGATVIEGQYRLNWVSRLAWFVLFGLGLFGIVATLVAIMLALISGEAITWQLLLLGAVPVGILVLLPITLNTHYDTAQAQDNRMVTLLKQLLEAHEQPSDEYNKVAPNMSLHWTASTR